MGIKVVMLPNGMLHGLPHQPNGMHLTPEGYHTLAEQLVLRLLTSAFGTKRTSVRTPPMSAFWGKADIGWKRSSM
jgi:hypothetical protein